MSVLTGNAKSVIHTLRFCSIYYSGSTKKVYEYVLSCVENSTSIINISLFAQCVTNCYLFLTNVEFPKSICYVSVSDLGINLKVLLISKF